MTEITHEFGTQSIVGILVRIFFFGVCGDTNQNIHEISHEIRLRCFTRTTRLASKHHHHQLRHFAYIIVHIIQLATQNVCDALNSQYYFTHELVVYEYVCMFIMNLLTAIETKKKKNIENLSFINRFKTLCQIKLRLNVKQ